jgi:GntR family transcriptional regulator
MFFDIDPSNGVAIYEQIVRQVSFAVAGQALRPGEAVPSVRQLARQLAINPNTVARAFRDLQDQNILQTVRGTGVAVTKGAKTKCISARTRVIRDRLRDVLAEARQSQLDDTELQTIIEAELENSKKRKL